MSAGDVEQIFAEAWAQENIHEAMEDVQGSLQRSARACERINFMAARRRAIAWRAAMLRGENVPPPRFRSRVTVFTPRPGGSSLILFGAGEKTSRKVMFGRAQKPDAEARCSNCLSMDHARQDCLKPPMKREDGQ